MNLLENAPTAATAAKDSCDRIMGLSEVAAFLSCSHEDARRFLTSTHVPCFRLESGGYRFLYSNLIHALKENSRPFDEESRRSNEVVEAWEFWLSARSSDVSKDLGVNWKSWLQLMAEQRIMPEEFQHFELDRKKDLLNRVKGNHSPALLDGPAASRPAAANPKSTAITTVRGRFAERKSFE
ncbi:MAG: hypothetical protein HY291_02930 [Planctomycetes bacterium]|nr:hypothetical protein [Planctomycetota bacterium]